MKNKIHYSRQAQNDLEDIWEYITLELRNPIAAEATVNGIMDAVDNLKIFSETGAILHLPNGLNSGYRFVQYENYLAFYRISQNDVFVDRVIYSKRDYMRILFEI